MASYAMLTDVGRNKEAEALANGTPLEIAEIAWGDGERIPAGGETALENEQARKPVALRGVKEGALNTVFFEVLLAEDEGPYVIREAGLFDRDGDMIAIAHYDPEIKKAVNTVAAYLRMSVVFSDLENLIIHLDVTTTKRPPTVTILRSGANAIYTTPEFCVGLHVKATAAGAGGETRGQSLGEAIYCHPGGSGAGFEAWLKPAPLEQFVYTVGLGGAPGSSLTTFGGMGGQGGNTIFGHIGANGGTNLISGETAHASGGDMNYRGSPGVQNWHASRNGREFPKLPGGSIFGPSDSQNFSQQEWQDATVPGTGGAGGYNKISNGSVDFSPGRRGANGIIVVTEYYG